jgi:hypothetical protein
MKYFIDSALATKFVLNQNLFLFIVEKQPEVKVIGQLLSKLSKCKLLIFDIHKQCQIIVNKIEFFPILLFNFFSLIYFTKARL